MDISFCTSEKSNGLVCPQRGVCKRYLLQLDKENWSELQSWIYPPFEIKDEKFECELFWKIGKTKLD